MERSGMEGYGKENGVGALISLYGFRLAGLSSVSIGWLASTPIGRLPALRLAGFQYSDWLASSNPIGHNYTLIYAVMMYSSLYSYIRCRDTLFTSVNLSSSVLHPYCLTRERSIERGREAIVSELRFHWKRRY